MTTGGRVERAFFFSVSGLPIMAHPQEYTGTAAVLAAGADPRDGHSHDSGERQPHHDHQHAQDVSTTTARKSTPTSANTFEHHACMPQGRESEWDEEEVLADAHLWGWPIVAGWHAQRRRRTYSCSPSHARAAVRQDDYGGRERTGDDGARHLAVCFYGLCALLGTAVMVAVMLQLAMNVYF